MKKVLFVCSGNTCRSPMAEGYLNFRLKKDGSDKEWTAISGGLHTMSGLPAHPQSKECAEADHIDLSAHRSQPITENLVNDSSLIFTMTSEHKRELLEHFPEAQLKVYSFKELPSIKRDIPDPIGLGTDVYHHVYEDIKKGVDEIHEMIIKRESPTQRE